MGVHTLKFTPFRLPLFIFFFLLFIFPIFVRAQDDICAKVNCMRGTCIPYNASIFGFDCVCYSGWKKVQIGYFTLPICMLPNCTVNFQCGNGAPPVPPPPPPSTPPPFNLSNPCNLVWCGDGTCVANGTGHKCECNAGSANFLNLTDLTCLKQCSLEADCSGLGLGPHALPPPPPNGTFALPPPSPPPPDGSTNISKSSRTWEAFNKILSAIILALFL